MQVRSLSVPGFFEVTPRQHADDRGGFLGSPTFGQWDVVLLGSIDRRAVYLPEGVGHAFTGAPPRSGA